MDALLEPWLRAREEVEGECLAELIRNAEPIIRRVVRSRLAGRWDDMDDVCSEARLELLLYLRRMKSEPGKRAIGEFSSYVATMARNTCHHYFRRRRPGRARLSKQIRHLLEQDPLFRMIDGVCGLARWSEKLPQSHLAEASDIAGDRDLGVLLERIFERAAGPLRFDSVVELVSFIWRVAPDPLASSGPLDPETMAAPATHPEVSIDHRRYVASLWKEIGGLPRGQRVALLLNLRDGRGYSVLPVLLLLEVASLAEVAIAMEVTESELERMWIDLPWDDNAIGRLLMCPRQQVINLRMAARKRLANRLGASGNMQWPRSSEADRSPR